MDALRIEWDTIALDAVAGTIAGHRSEAFFRTIPNYCP